jgi:hypothetical protein
MAGQIFGHIHGHLTADSTLGSGGDHNEPDAEDIIRTGGNPTSGACELAGGEQVQPY